MYKIEMRHGEFTWIIKKKEKHFVDLHRELRTYKTFMRLPLPSRRSEFSMLSREDSLNLSHDPPGPED